jgi:signal transduction histidine kinase
MSCQFDDHEVCTLLQPNHPAADDGILMASLLTLVVLAAAFVYLIRTLEKMRTLDEMKTDFTNNMTHELKTPIAVAYAANDALLNFDAADDPERRHRYLDISRQQLQRLAGLVEQILSMSMERRKAMRLSLEDVPLRPLAEAVAEEHRLKADKPADITVDVPGGLTVRADRTHLANMVSNLVDNAVKYSPGRAEVRIAATRTPQGDVVVSVADHGMGIPPDKQRYVFDRFYRVPHGNLHEVKGYGLGLYYVKSMMEKMGGEVALDSRPGQGTTFKLTFYG